MSQSEVHALRSAWTSEATHPKCTKDPSKCMKDAHHSQDVPDNCSCRIGTVREESCHSDRTGGARIAHFYFYFMFYVIIEETVGMFHPQFAFSK